MWLHGLEHGGRGDVDAGHGGADGVLAQVMRQRFDLGQLRHASSVLLRRRGWAQLKQSQDWGGLSHTREWPVRFVGITFRLKIINDPVHLVSGRRHALHNTFPVLTIGGRSDDPRPL